MSLLKDENVYGKDKYSVIYELQQSGHSLNPQYIKKFNIAFYIFPA